MHSKNATLLLKWTVALMALVLFLSSVARAQVTFAGAQRTRITGLVNPDQTIEDSAGNLYVANPTAGNIVLKVAPDGTQTQIALQQVYSQQGIAIDSAGNLYIAD